MKMLRILKKCNTLLGWFASGLLIAGGILLFATYIYAQDPSTRSAGNTAGWGFIAAALAVGLSSVAAGMAVSAVGSAAMGAVSERPELMGRSLIYVGLAEGIAIYGLIVSIMILGKI